MPESNRPPPKRGAARYRWMQCLDSMLDATTRGGCSTTDCWNNLHLTLVTVYLLGWVRWVLKLTFTLGWR